MHPGASPAVGLTAHASGHAQHVALCIMTAANIYHYANCFSHSAAAGASYEVTDPDKGNPAQIAAYWGHLEAVVKLVEAGCSWPHGKTARGVAGGDVVKWICNITTNKVGV